MSRIVTLFLLLLAALPALAAPPKLEAGSYLLAPPIAEGLLGRDVLKQVDYQPGMVRLKWKSGKLIEVPVLGHLAPTPGGSGVLLLASDPTQIRKPYHPALVYELTPDKQVVWIQERHLSGTRDTAIAQAKALSRRRADQDRLFVGAQMLNAWPNLPALDPKDRELMLAFLWESVHYNWADSTDTDKSTDLLHWLLHHGYNPITSIETAEGWAREHQTDQEVRQALASLKTKLRR